MSYFLFVFKESSHQVFVPCLVGGGPPQDVVDDVIDYKADEEEGTNSHPHDFPVYVGCMSNHVLYVLFKPINN